MAGKILTTRVDPDVAQDAEKILNALGISRSVAINMFYRMVILKRGLPWRPNLDESDYVASNPKLVEQIEQGIKDFEEGKFIIPVLNIEDEIDRL